MQSLKLQIQKTIDDATSDKLDGPDHNLNQAVITIINSGKDSPKHAAAYLIKKISSNDSKVILMSLIITDMAIYKCGTPLQK